MEATALFDFQPSQDDEICCRKDDRVIILKANMERNWCKGLLCKKVGLVPKTFIRLKPIPGFMGAISRSTAEELLSKVAIKESFLVRESETSPGDFTISIWLNGIVRHAMITQDSDMNFKMYEKSFDNINSLMEHHQTNSIARSENIRLLHPVPESLVFSVAESHKAREKNELSAIKGDRVIVTDYSDKNWWTGVCGQEEGMFPVRFLQPINYPTIFENHE